MHVVVCVKIVSQAHLTDSFSDNTQRLSAGQLVINPADEYALETALRIKDESPSVRVTVLSLSPDLAEHALRYTLAMGADEAVLVCDPRFAGSDTLITSAALAAAIRKIPSADLILSGQKSIDSETGHVGSQLSTRLDLPYVSSALSLRITDGCAVLERLQDGGTVRLSCRLPLSVSLCKGTQMVRIPGILGQRRARTEKICRFSHADLDLLPALCGKGSPTSVIKMEKAYHPPRKSAVLSDASSLLKLLGGEKNA